MRVKGAFKILLCFALSLPAAAVQPDSEDALTKFRQEHAFQGPTTSYPSQQRAVASIDDSYLPFIFSLFSITMIMLAVRSQQRQDYSKYRDPRFK
ncbi:hypothetical protein [Alteromonas lipolytica]|uniref:Uncharacterized protein n=1 Tax=Alteromonas lipolytica TaxID=1856405 RepID=A0A1E8FBJ6_9ALTE|nr:hypothetical protein [Alteromonas lipolytica]OFI33279.1 hypothetical protein BFC17_03190 [Alteromonas lipolytica]GGF61073.1 hypothetical protein GCM10011338_11650 [Alteromonas lipolytica]